MTEKTITLQGQQYPVRFDLQTILNFEEITGGSIFADKLTTMKSRIALIMAAVLSADTNTALTVEAIMGAKDWQAAQDILHAYTIVDALASDFFKVPDIEQQAEQEESQADGDGEQPKN